MKPTTLYLIPVMGLITAFALHLPVRRKWRNPVTSSGYAVLLLGAVALFHSLPPVIHEVNAVVGIANFSAALVYALSTSFSGSVIALMINWRGGEPERMRRAWRLCLSIFSTCSAAVVVLFILGDAPVERVADFDTYYATTPFICEMIILYLAAQSIAVLILMRLCLTWQREVNGTLRAGLRLIITGGWFDLVYQLSKYTSIVARWTGHNLDFLSTSIAPVLISIAAFLVATGFALPRVGPSLASHWSAFVQYRQLAPLWSNLCHVRVPIQPLATWWQLPQDRLALRQTAIHDALLRLNPHFDRQVYTTARAVSLANRQSTTEADITAEAAVIAAAIRSSAAGAPPSNPDGIYTLKTTEESVHALVQVSRALTRSLTTTSGRTHGGPRSA